MLYVVFLSFCTIIHYSLIGIYGSDSETDADNLVYEDNEVFTINVPLDDDESEEDDDSVEYTLEKPRFEDGLLKDYEETVVEANIQHNENFDRHSNKKLSVKLKRQLSKEDEYTWRYVTVSQPEIIYDYEQFKNEYDHQIEEMKKNQPSFNETEFISPPKTECATDKFYHVGPFTIRCLLKEYFGEHENLREDAYVKLLSIGQFWAIILIILIVFGWAHLEDGYEEVKRYLVLNPPGVLVRNIIPKSNTEMKTVIQKEIYRPTETEHYLYNSLWQTVYNV